MTFTPAPIRYAVLYARFSPRSKSSQCLSCDIQLADLRAYCERYGLVIRGEYRDDAISGKSVSGRLGLTAALAAVKRGDVFLCRDTSRLSRSMLDSFKLATIIVKKGAILQTLTDGSYDPNDPNSILGFGVRAVMNQVQRMQISKSTKTKVNKYQNVDNRRMSKVLPFGKQSHPTDDKLMVDCEEEQAIVNRILDLRASGLGPRAIVNDLHGAGILFRGKPTWHHTTIRNILRRAASVRP